MAAERLDVRLVELGLFESRARARAAIQAGKVRVDGVPALKPAQTVLRDARIEAEAAHPYVGRGALKLAHALDIWPIPVGGRTAVDIGASTGGFTEVLLLRGAAFVFAVDVGRGQLHPSLADDPRVANLEATDARTLTAELIDRPFDLIVSDVSFISLTKALPAALSLAAAGSDLVCLVKPQFEAGPEWVGKGGLVRDPEAHLLAMRQVTEFLTGAGWRVEATADSPVEGGDGAVEHLLWARKTAG